MAGDSYGTWGDWDLQQFKVEIVRWRDTTHPPPESFRCANQWWPLLKQPTARAGAVRVSPDRDPDQTLHWMWVPGADWLDEQAGYFRVQCRFRVFQLASPPRLVCTKFLALPSLTPSELDRADGMG